jgi:hypothetical protein
MGIKAACLEVFIKNITEERRTYREEEKQADVSFVRQEDQTYSSSSSGWSKRKLAANSSFLSQAK